MALNQNQIKNLRFDTVLEAELQGRPNEICFVRETNTWYKFDELPVGMSRDGLSILDTGVIDRYWLAFSGQYTINNIFMMDGNFIYLRGDANTDGSVRVSSSGTGIFLVEARASGVWEEIDIHGDVVGPAASTDNALARYDGVTGKLIQNSDAILDDAGNLSITGELSASQGYTGTQTLGANQTLGAGLTDNVIIGDSVVVTTNITQSVMIGGGVSGVSAGQSGMVIIGYNAYANAAARSVLIGSGIGADRKNTVAIGYEIYGGGEGNVLLGLGCNGGSSSTKHSNLFGTSTYIDSSAGIAIGAMANAWSYAGSSKTDNGCVAIGSCSRASGHFIEAGKAGGVALGEGSVAIGEGSIAVGYGSGSFNVDASGFNNQALTLNTVAGLSVGDEIQRDGVAVFAVIFAIVGSTIHVIPDSPGEWFEAGDTFGSGTYTVQNVSFPQQQYRGPEGANYVTLLGGFSGLPKNADMESAIGIGFGSTIVAENVCQIGNNLTTVTVSDITGFTPGLAVTDGVGSGTVLDTELGFNRIHIHTTSTGNFTVGNTLTDGDLVSSEILSVVRFDQGNINTIRVGRGVETITVPNTIGLGGLLLGGQTVDTIETTLTDDDTHLPTSGAVYESNIKGGTSIVEIDNTDSPYSASYGEFIVADCSSGNIIINIPTAVGNTNKELKIKRLDNSLNTITYDGNSTETIDGSTTGTIDTQWEVVGFKSNGTNLYRF